MRGWPPQPTVARNGFRSDKYTSGRGGLGPRATKVAEATSLGSPPTIATARTVVVFMSRSGAA